MTQKVTATGLIPRAEREMGQRLTATTDSGEPAEIFIPSQLFSDLTEATQSLMLRSIELAGRMGGQAILEASRVGLSRRGNLSRLALSTQQLGTVSFALNEEQWRELEGIVAQVLRGGASLQ